MAARLHYRKNFGSDPPKKWYRPITFVKKYWSFLRAIGAYGPAETSVFLYKSFGSILFFLVGLDQNFFCSVNAPLISTLFYGILVYISSYIIICLVWYTCIRVVFSWVVSLYFVMKTYCNRLSLWLITKDTDCLVKQSNIKANKVQLIWSAWKWVWTEWRQWLCVEKVV